MLQLNHLAGCLALFWLIGAQLSPEQEVITPGVSEVVPETRSRSSEQVVQGADGVLHVVFRAYKRSERKTAVYYTRSEPAGAWSGAIQISEEASDCGAPVIAACPDGRLLVSWIDTAVEDRFVVAIRSSDDSGKTWTSCARLPSGVTRVRPKIAVSGTAAYVCLSSAPREGVGERVYFFRSGDGGKTWEEKNVNFKSPRSQSSQVDLLARGENVWVTWCDQDQRGVGSVVLASSTDRGETWPREPVVVSDPRPETPSDATFDRSQPGVVIVWRGAHPGATSFVYEDRCEDGTTCGKDHIILQSDVIPITYRIVKYSNNRVLLCLRSKGGLDRQQHQIYWADITDKSISLTDQQVVVWPGAEHANFSEFDVRVVNGTLYLAAVARFGAGDWRLLLLSRKADGQDQQWVIGGEQRKERSSLALVPFRGEIGWLFQERRPRMLPMESPLNDSLVFGHLDQHQ